MKKFFTLASFVVFFILINLSAFAGDLVDFQGGHGGRGGHAEAPLDGGLLAILAAAGITYFAARKRKKNKE